MELSFEWDPKKAASNRDKHGVSFEEPMSAPEGRRDSKGETMKKAPPRRGAATSTRTRTEYRFDYRKAKRNRFAGRVSKNAVVVVLAPDVTSVFSSSDSVNALLRSVIKAMPDHGKKRRNAG